MSVKLELIFRNQEGKTSKVEVDNPSLPIDAEAIANAMDEIIAADTFSYGKGLVAKVGARLVERTVEDIEIDLN